MAKIDAIAQAVSAAGRSSDRSGGATSDEVRAFVQQRVASFALLISLVFTLFLTWRLVAVAVSSPDPGGTGYLPFQAAGVASMAAVWLLLRGRARPLRFVRAVEAAGFTLGCIALTMMAIHIPYSARPDIIVVQAFTLLLVGRSIYVPSSARQTLLIGGLLTAVAVAAGYLIALRGFDPTMFTGPAAALREVSPPDVAIEAALVAFLWSAAAVVIAAAASRVIYGLRAEVRDARRLGQYTLHEKLGSGGMGEVYRASHALLRRPAAIKLLPPDKLGEVSVARFEREVQLTALLTHPNTVRVFDYGRTAGGVFYYAMELLEGASLAQLVAARGRMPPARVIHILVQCAGALAEAHAVGLIHRDIKPANILLTEQGGEADVAKVVDFGLVKAVADGTGSGEAPTVDAVTRDDAVAGTPQTMAPEAITGPEAIDARADLYALGAVGYFLLTGADVFTGRNALEILSHHLHTEPVPPSRRGAAVPADLEAIILACLEKDRARRPASARELRAALAACGDAGRWSQEDARAWWREHGAALRGRPAAGPLAAASTVAIDLGGRAV